MNLLEFQRILAYQMSSGQNAAAWLSLCPNRKPEQESGHLGLLLLLGTLFKREGKYTHYKTHINHSYSAFPTGPKEVSTYPSLSKNWLPCPSHQHLESKLTSLPKSQLYLHFSHSLELNHNLLITMVKQNKTKQPAIISITWLFP